MMGIFLALAGLGGGQKNRRAIILFDFCSTFSKKVEKNKIENPIEPLIDPTQLKIQIVRRRTARFSTDDALVLSMLEVLWDMFNE